MFSRFERFSFTVFSICRCWRRLASDEMEKHGLKGSYAVYLNAMYPSGGITAAQLCELCDKNKAAVSRAVAEMEKKGLIKREGTGTSLYRAKLYLTEQGEQAARHVCERARLAVELAGEGITEEDRRIFYETLDKISANLQILSRQGLPETEKERTNL